MKMLRAFAATRRSAVAVIMAVSLAPLMFLVGIAIDVTFLSQTRTQTAFAAQAAATQATRIAAATYQYETNYLGQAIDGQTMTQTLAAQDAIAAGNAAGNLWYPAEVGTLTRGSNAPVTTLTTYDGATTGAINTSQPPNFQAVVSDVTTYPPIFNPLFNQTKNWVYSSNATASTQFQYAEIMLMLDTSGSMLIGADESDILTMEQGSVCPSYVGGKPEVISSETSGNISGVLSLQYGGDYQYAAVDNDAVDFRGAEPNYPATAANDTSEGCLPGTGLAAPSNYNGYTTAKYNGTVKPVPAEPCALACHNSTVKTSDGFYADAYGLARREGVTLRLDVLFQATEEVIQDMETSEAVADQLSVGVYHFDTDVFPIVNGATGSGGTLPEATADLASALSAVDAVDYKQTPSETKIPQLINGWNGTTITPTETTANTGGDTDFPKSLQDLENGTAWSQSNGKNQALTAAGNGNTQATPLKFMFIVTDGMEDDSTNNGGPANNSPYGNVEGEMTSISGETAGSGTCSYLKNTLGYTVYVLYVDYYPVASGAYYQAPTPGGRYTNANTNGDYPADVNTNIQTLTEVTADQGQANDAEYANAPVAKALQACATTPTDFYEANSSSSIQTALSDMLKSALASTIKLTN